MGEATKSKWTWLLAVVLAIALGTAGTWALRPVEVRAAVAPAVQTGAAQQGKQPQQKHEKEAAVPPGINDTWRSADIDPLVERLETESREIFRQSDNLAALVGPLPGGAIADIGAGSGFMALEFAKLVGPKGKVYAVDINPQMMERLGRLAAEHGYRNIETIVGKDDDPLLKERSVDIVFICDTYHHFEYPMTMMKAVHKALRPGGQVVLVEFNREPGAAAFVFEHVRAGKEQFAKEIEGAGFELINDHKVPWLTENYALRFQKKR